MIIENSAAKGRYGLMVAGSRWGSGQPDLQNSISCWHTWSLPWNCLICGAHCSAADRCCITALT